MLPESTDPTDRFMIEARSRSGGMGDIFKGTDQSTGAPVALKVLRAAASPQERARFAREISILADLRHPNIVQYIAHGTCLDGRLFFAMEWLDGEDLGQRQRRARSACATRWRSSGAAPPRWPPSTPAASSTATSSSPTSSSSAARAPRSS